MENEPNVMLLLRISINHWLSLLLRILDAIDFATCPPGEIIAPFGQPIGLQHVVGADGIPMVA